MESRVNRILILLFFCWVTTQQSFVCMDAWRSDGNFYDFNQCMIACRRSNQGQQVDNVKELSTNCCTPICYDQIAYHKGKRIAIIVVVSVLVFIVFVCCMFGCFGPSIKKKFVLTREKQLRKTVHNGMSAEEFDKLASQFSCIFQQDEHDNWEISFIVQGIKFPMQWFAFNMKKKRSYHYNIEISGQDGFGLWNVDGYITNTQKGFTVWGVKNYENVQNSTVFFDNYSDIIMEINRNTNGDYKGLWYRRSQKTKSGECFVLRKGDILKSQENIDKYEVVSE